VISSAGCNNLRYLFSECQGLIVFSLDKIGNAQQANLSWVFFVVLFQNQAMMLNIFFNSYAYESL
jgi:hypothetical protein